MRFERNFILSWQMVPLLWDGSYVNMLVRLKTDGGYYKILKISDSEACFFISEEATRKSCKHGYKAKQSRYVVDEIECARRSDGCSSARTECYWWRKPVKMTGNYSKDEAMIVALIRRAVRASQSVGRSKVFRTASATLAKDDF